MTELEGSAQFRTRPAISAIQSAQPKRSCDQTLLDARSRLPSWVPKAVQRYLTHTEAGLPIREVARREGCHASTVLRQIRRVETRRDDPLVDKALTSLGTVFFAAPGAPSEKEKHPMGHQSGESKLLEDAAQLDAEALRVLRRLTETGAVLAVAEGMETAVVVRESADGSSTRTLSVGAHHVQAMALNAWISCNKPGRISRYCITHSGRTKLAQLTSRASGDAQSHGAPTGGHEEFGAGGRNGRTRYCVTESPVTGLSRRKDKNGVPFLSDSLVHAAERLREDFELAQMGPRVTQNWDSFLTAGTRSDKSRTDDSPDTGPGKARARVEDALRFLGPGLSDVALRCCCYLEGLESAEKRMGWSARSGKIVLRIALQRLNHFYETEVGEVLIG